MKSKRWSLYGEYKGKISSILAGNIISNFPRGAFTGLLYLIIIAVTSAILDGTKQDFNLLTKYYWYYVAAFLFYILFTVIGQTNNFVQSYKISSDLRLKLGEKLRKLSLGFFKRNDPGDVTSRMLHDVSKAEEVLSHNLPDVIAGIIVPILLGSFLAFINLKLSLILFGIVIFAMIFFMIARKTIEVLGKKHLKAINKASSRILEYARTIKPLKSYDMIGDNYKELDKAMIHLKKLSFRAEVFAGIPVQIAMLILDIGYLLMLLIAIKMTLVAEISIPVLFTFVILGFYFFEPIKNIGIIMVLLRHAANSTDRIEEIFSTPEPEFQKNTKLPDIDYFQFDDVKFKYKDEYVLNGINCHIPAKSMTALVGVSGSGKTTMTNLMARFWDIQSGTISYGGVNIKDIEPEKLLSNISMVFQDVFLFNDTIMNNIRIGNKSASDEEVINAAKLAQCHWFIDSLPHGYDTILSEGGKTLSGGERQRISIARAILKDAPVILLDEATASLDPENENEIQEALSNLVKNKTLIVIVHKFNSIENAKQILVLDKGEIIESGTHDELIMKNGLYNKLWKAQQQAGSWKIRK